MFFVNWLTFSKPSSSHWSELAIWIVNCETTYEKYLVHVWFFTDSRNAPASLLWSCCCHSDLRFFPHSGCKHVCVRTIPVSRPGQSTQKQVTSADGQIYTSYVLSTMHYFRHCTLTYSWAELSGLETRPYIRVFPCLYQHLLVCVNMYT